MRAFLSPAAHVNHRHRAPNLTETLRYAEVVEPAADEASSQQCTNHASTHFCCREARHFGPRRHAYGNASDRLPPATDTAVLGASWRRSEEPRIAVWGCSSFFPSAPGLLLTAPSLRCSGDDRLASVDVNVLHRDRLAIARPQLLNREQAPLKRIHHSGAHVHQLHRYVRIGVLGGPIGKIKHQPVSEGKFVSQHFLQ